MSCDAAPRAAGRRALALSCNYPHRTVLFIAAIFLQLLVASCFLLSPTTQFVSITGIENDRCSPGKQTAMVSRGRSESANRRRLAERQMVPTFLPASSASPPSASVTSASLLRLALSPQQLGEFEPVGAAHTVEAREARRVQLYDYSGEAPIPFREMWDVQRAMVDGHLGRLTAELKESKTKEPGRRRTSVPPLVASSQFLSIDVGGGATDAVDDGEEPAAAAGGHDRVIMLQHAPVYTLGTGSDPGFIKSASEGGELSDVVDVVRIERGGEVTYHGPGQLVVYPILDLRGYRQDIHWYMRALEEAILMALKSVGVRGAIREDDVTGVWVSGRKIAALGIKARRWVTMHGLAVNVDERSLANFEGIVPCGLVGRDVCCVNDHLEKPITVDEFARHMKDALEHVFEMRLVTHP